MRFSKHTLLAVNTICLPSVLAWLVFSVVVSGCGDTSGRVGVSGRVVFSENRPIDRGVIEFSLHTNEATKVAGAPIVDGLYKIPREKGLVAGKYRVRIYSPTATTHAAGPPGATRQTNLPKERVAKRFNTETQLAIEVRPGVDQRFDFEVE